MIIIKNKKETRTGSAIENDMRLLAAEIYRIIKLPYSTARNKHKILYLEELLAAYERDAKKHD